MINIQIMMDEENYIRLIQKKTTKRSWKQFLLEEILDD